MNQTPTPSLEFEIEQNWPTRLIAGVDEVGRGPLAGEVVATAVILPQQERPWFAELADSKKLSQSKREKLYDIIMAECDVGIGRGTLQDIETLNILWASMLAMERAVGALSQTPDHVLIDGNRAPNGLVMPTTCLVKGDGRSCSIAAASIVAKVTRDREMLELHDQFPQYDWASNKGYPSPKHRQALADFGPSPYHRRGFKLGA